MKRLYTKYDFADAVAFCASCNCRFDYDDIETCRCPRCDYELDILRVCDFCHEDFGDQDAETYDLPHCETLFVCPTCNEKIKNKLLYYLRNISSNEAYVAKIMLEDDIEGLLKER